RLFKELETRNRDLSESLDRQTATANILRVISRSQTDPGPVFDTILTSTLRLCGAQIGTVFRLVDGTIHPAACQGPEAYRGIVRERWPRTVDGTTLVGRSMLERRPVHVPDLEEADEFPAARNLSRLGGYRSLLSVPMLQDETVIGCIAI